MRITCNQQHLKSIKGFTCSPKAENKVTEAEIACCSKFSREVEYMNRGSSFSKLDLEENESVSWKMVCFLENGHLTASLLTFGLNNCFFPLWWTV